MMKRFLSGAALLVLLLTASPVFAASQEDVARGERLMEMMMGSQHEAAEQALEARMGSAFVEQMHEAMGRMGEENLTGGAFGMMPLGMMRMMTGGSGGFGFGGGMMGPGGFGFGALALIGWIWLITWTVNSILLAVLLWVLIKRYSNKKSRGNA